MGDAPRRVQGELAREVETRRVSRRKRAREIALLREREGLSFAEIAERLELATSTVRDYHRDPDAERNRRIASAIGANANSAGARRPATAATTPRASALGAHARGRECGAPIGSSAIREWRDLTGRAPTVPDWSPAHADEGHPGAARFLTEAGRWPSVAAVQAHFGSFSAALEAAGVEHARRGARTRWTPDRIVEAMRMWQRAHGKPPTHEDWQRSSDDHPARSTVSRVMGSWEAALEAASR